MSGGYLKTHSTQLLLRGLLCLLLSSISSIGWTQQDSGAEFRQLPAADHYINAKSLIDARSFSEALTVLRRIQIYYPGFEKISEVQTRIAVLQEADGAGNALTHYLSALDKRDTGDVSGAISSLDFVLLEYPDNTLNDDAMYLKAYVQIMDRYDFAEARKTLATLQQKHAESSYQDSADYLDAIALEQLGDTVQARTALEALRDKHTAVSLPFGFNWPSGNVLSRYWFDRADKRLAIIEKRFSDSSKMRSKQTSDAGIASVKVNVDGIDLVLNLSPSPLTRQTEWVNGVLEDRPPPAAGVFVGTVVGDDDSWVRAVIIDNTISGVAEAFGQRYTMQPGTLIGTLDYYQPRSHKTRSAGNPDSISTEAELTHDVIHAPREVGALLRQRMATRASDLRVVPISIVIDAEFDRYHGGNGLVIALNQLNVADGIYRQFGIALAVDEVQVFTDTDANPMATAPATLETYLKSFREYRLERKTFFAGSALTYLFTGKQRTDRTLGLAWIDTLCRTDGYDVGITTPSAIGDVLLTHEIGHSLGSQHDSDTACNQDSSKIMWPNISSNTQAQFSDCSQEMLSGARNKTCLVDAVDLALYADESFDGVRFELSNLDSSVAIDATLNIETSAPGLVAWPNGCNMTSPTSANCAISRMVAGERRDVFLAVEDMNLVNDAVVTGELTPVGTQDFTPANNSVSHAIGTPSTGVQIADTSAGQQPANDQPAAASGGAISYWWLLVLMMLRRRHLSVLSLEYCGRL